MQDADRKTGDRKMEDRNFSVPEFFCPLSSSLAHPSEPFGRLRKHLSHSGTKRTKEDTFRVVRMP
jgi:hypothetical protein